MSFRKKIIIFVILVSAGLLILLYSSLLLVLSKNFSYLENDAVDLRLRRAENDSQIYFNALKSKVLDWAEWDDSYNFVIDHNEDFVRSNFNDSSLKNLDVSAIVYADNQGNVIGSHAYDFIAEQADASFSNLFKGKLSDPYFRDYFMKTDFKQGIVLLPGNRPPLYLVSKKILRSDQSGPSLGYVFMGRFLDRDFVDYRFGDVALYSTILERVDNPNLTPDFFEARNKLIMNDAFVIIPGGPKNIYGYSLFKDYSDNPAFIFRIETDRTLYQYEINILMYVSILLFAMILIFVVIFLWMINRIFVSRLLVVFNKVEEYKKNPEAENINITISGKDELSKLSDEFNNLVKEIYGSRDFYRSLLISLPDIIILAKAGRAIYVNDAFAVHTGFSKEDILGKDIVNFVEKDYQDLALKNMRLRYSGVDVLPYTMKIITKKEPMDVRASGRIIDYHGDRVDLLVLTDISSSVSAQRRIEEKVAELERLNRVMINRELKMMDLKKKIEASGGRK